MKKLITTIIITFVLSALFAQETSFSGEVSTLWGVKTPGTDLPGNFTVGKNDFTGSLEVYQGNGTAFLEGSIGYDLIQKSVDYDLSEAYIDYSSSFWGFRIGAQKVAWGKADGINITNSVFPSDSTSLFNDDESLSINAARVSVNGSFFTVDGFWIPFFRGNKLPLEDNNSLREVIIPSKVTIDAMGTDLSIPVNIGNLTAPELSLKNSEYGLKSSAYLPFCDISLYGFYGWDKTPLMSYKLNTVLHPVYEIEIPESITINGEYKRMTMIGFDAAFPIGAVVLRLENAYFPERMLQTSAETILSGGEIYEKQHQLMGLAGIDWMPSGWTITAQYYYDYIINKSDKLQRTDSYTHGATLSVSKSLLQETLDIYLSGLLGLNDFDSAVTFSTKYSLSDQLKLSAGCYVFLPGPEREGTYGKFKDMSSVYIRCQYCF